MFVIVVLTKPVKFFIIFRPRESILRFSAVHVINAWKSLNHAVLRNIHTLRLTHSIEVSDLLYAVGGERQLSARNGSQLHNTTCTIS